MEPIQAHDQQPTQRWGRTWLLQTFCALSFLGLSPEVSADLSEPPATAQPLAQSLAQSAAWLRLGHYRSTWTGGYLSEINGDGFFLASDGRSNPTHELETDLRLIAAAQSEPSGDDSIPCKIPARFAFLRSHLPEGQTWREPSCPRYEHFRDGISATSATLVFSSYYLNNPSSAFGHTFIRLNKDAANGGRYPLLDYGIGFAATVDKITPFNMAVGGFMGWLPGEFTNVPYYLKVQEYNDFDSRDLWEYDLNLSPGEVQLLVAHFWELAHAKINYKYLSANCASLLFSAIEAAAPRLELTKQLPFWVIPSDTIRAIWRVPGLIVSSHYRPSKRSQLMARLAMLKPESLHRVAEAARSGDQGQAAASLTGPDAGIELDTLIDNFDYHNFKRLAAGESEATRIKQAILVQRSHYPPSEPLKIETPELERPELGHGSARAAAGVMSSKLNGQWLSLGQRFALHDLLDPQTGYQRDSAISFFDLELDAQPQNLRLERFYLFSVQSLSPYLAMLPNWSWKLRMGAERTFDESCLNCVAAVVGGSYGLTGDFLARHIAFVSLLIDTDIDGGDFANSKIKFRLGPELNLRVIATPHLIFSANAVYLRIFLENTLDAVRFREEARYALPDWPLAMSASLTQLPRGDIESRLQVLLYY